MLESIDKGYRQLSTRLFITMESIFKRLFPSLELHHDVPQQVVCFVLYPTPNCVSRQTAEVLFLQNANRVWVILLQYALIHSYLMCVFFL